MIYFFVNLLCYITQQLIKQSYILNSTDVVAFFITCGE